MTSFTPDCFFFLPSSDELSDDDDDDDDDADESSEDDDILFFFSHLTLPIRRTSPNALFVATDEAGETI
jgi:hypothetical protein